MKLIHHLSGGAWAGLTIPLTVTPQLRPTKQRVRQAGLNLLASRLPHGHNWQGLMLADLCAGTGLWGLEAASRGASVWLIDTHPAPAAASLQALQRHHPTAPVQVVAANALTWQPPQPLNLVVIDPPYTAAPHLLPQLLARAAQLSAPGAWWLLETNAHTPLTFPAGFTHTGHRTYGLTTLHWAQFS